MNTFTHDPAPRGAGQRYHSVSKREAPTMVQESILADWTLDLVERTFGIDRGSILSRKRGSMSVVLARQVTAYLLHTRLGFSLSRAGRHLGRHRSTILHSLRQLEGMRDDPVLDGKIDRLDYDVEVLTGILGGSQA